MMDERIGVVVREAIVRSPYGRLLGIEVESVAPDRVCLRLPYRPEVVTVGDVIHGGAISSLVDVAATAAAWSGADPDVAARGTTVGFSVSFLSAARGAHLVAEACVLRRGKAICVCDVTVRGADGEPVAKALVTYKLG